jgi:two-component system, chemotaxis family, chemotaxis protein CheY
MTVAASIAKSNKPAIRHNVLVVDDSPSCCQLVKAALRGRNYDVLYAADGKAALEILSNSSVEVALVDYEMPGMTGLDLVKIIRGDPRWKKLPIVMLTGEAEKEIILQAGRLGVSSYVLKTNLSLPMLLARIEKIISAEVQRTLETKTIASTSAQGAESGVPHLLTRQEVVDAVLQITAAKSMSNSVAEIMAITASPDANVADLAEVIKNDPVLAARVLHLASSAAYATDKPGVLTIEDALRNIGTAATRDIVATAAVFEVFKGNDPHNLSLSRCWQHAIATAVIMTRIVPRNDTTPLGLPYLIGLCHDLPEILLRGQFPDQYATAAQFAMQRERTMESIFATVFGVGLDEVAAELLQGLKLPASIFKPIVEFALNACRPNHHQGELARALTIANSHAHGLLLDSSTQTTVGPVSQGDSRLASISAAGLNGAEIRSEVIATLNKLAKIPADKQKLASEPIVPQRDVKVWYARNANLTALDPLEAALQMLCKTVTHDRIPCTQDLAGLNGIVIVAPNAEAIGPMMDEARGMAGDKLHVLGLISETESLSTKPAAFEESATVTQIRYPVSISRLAQFVSSLP